MKIKFLLQNDPILRILSFNAFVRSWAKIATSARHTMFVLAPRHYKSIGLSLISHGMSRWRVLSPQVSHPTDIVRSRLSMVYVLIFPVWIRSINHANDQRNTHICEATRASVSEALDKSLNVECEACLHRIASRSEASIANSEFMALQASSFEREAINLFDVSER